MSLREENLRTLRTRGFRVAASLPSEFQETKPSLRPVEEIAKRALALLSTGEWVCARESQISSARILARIESFGLDEFLCTEDRSILGTPRAEAHEAHIGTIGWCLENVWSLAWVLGFEQQPSLQGMISDETVAELLRFFFAGNDKTLQNFLARIVPRNIHEIRAREDLFYCAHNAARSAQLGENTVPPDFDPISDGGVVHERRHALTWALSPGVAWEDTDLST